MVIETLSEEDKAPPDELAEQWRQESCDNQELANLIEQIQYIAAKAAAWGREQERASLSEQPSADKVEVPREFLHIGYRYKTMINSVPFHSRPDDRITYTHDIAKAERMQGIGEGEYVADPSKHDWEKLFVRVAGAKGNG